MPSVCTDLAARRRHYGGLRTLKLQFRFGGPHRLVDLDSTPALHLRGTPEVRKGVFLQELQMNTAKQDKRPS